MDKKIAATLIENKIDLWQFQLFSVWLIIGNITYLQYKKWPWATFFLEVFFMCQNLSNDWIENQFQINLIQRCSYHMEAIIVGHWHCSVHSVRWIVLWYFFYLFIFTAKNWPIYYIKLLNRDKKLCDSIISVIYIQQDR